MEESPIVKINSTLLRNHLILAIDNQHKLIQSHNKLLELQYSRFKWFQDKNMIKLLLEANKFANSKIDHMNKVLDICGIDENNVLTVTHESIAGLMCNNIMQLFK